MAYCGEKNRYNGGVCVFGRYRANCGRYSFGSTANDPETLVGRDRQKQNGDFMFLLTCFKGNPPGECRLDGS